MNAVSAAAQSDATTIVLAILNVIQIVLLAHISSRSTQRRRKPADRR